jgi:hypothetical protein
MKLTLKLRLLVNNLLERRKRKPVQRFQFKKPEMVKKPSFSAWVARADGFIKPFLKECGNVVYGDLLWLFTHRQTTAQQKWDEAVIQMQKESK